MSNSNINLNIYSNISVIEMVWEVFPAVTSCLIDHQFSHPLVPLVPLFLPPSPLPIKKPYIPYQWIYSIYYIHSRVCRPHNCQWRWVQYEYHCYNYYYYDYCKHKISLNVLKGRWPNKNIKEKKTLKFCDDLYFIHRHLNYIDDNFAYGLTSFSFLRTLFRKLVKIITILTFVFVINSTLFLLLPPQKKTRDHALFKGEQKRDKKNNQIYSIVSSKQTITKQQKHRQQQRHQAREMAPYIVSITCQTQPGRWWLSAC